MELEVWLSETRSLASSRENDGSDIWIVVNILAAYQI